MNLSVSYKGVQFQAYSAEELRKKGVPESIISEAVISKKNNDVFELRNSAYKSESDPLYMEWQYDKTDESERAWRDKVAEIKTRYPLPF